jgi:hypothetical protein
MVQRGVSRYPPSVLETNSFFNVNLGGATIEKMTAGVPSQ